MPRPSEAEIDEGDAVLEALIERIVAEAEAMPRICPWRVKTPENGEAFCTSHCAEQYRRKILPPPGHEHVLRSRPAPEASRLAFMTAARIARNPAAQEAAAR